MNMQDTVCAACGVVVAQARDGRWVHTDSLGENVAVHDVESVVTRSEHLFGQEKQRDAARAPAELHLMILERQAIALERIAYALDLIAQRLDT